MWRAHVMRAAGRVVAWQRAGGGAAVRGARMAAGRAAALGARAAGMPMRLRTTGVVSPARAVHTTNVWKKADGSPGAGYVFSLMEVSKAFEGQQVLFRNVSLNFLRGAKIGILGVNGTGKSTLMRIMAGEEKEYDGQVWTEPGARVGLLHQEPQLDNSKTVRENIEDGMEERNAVLARYDEVCNEMCEEDCDMDALLEEQARLDERIDFLGGWDIGREVGMAMDALRCPPEDAMVGPLSGGEKRRVALCKLLLSHPDVLLMDEPTNHLDAESVAWLEQYLNNYRGTVCVVTHDRYFLDNIVRWILELDRGSAYPFKGNYSEWLENKQKRLEGEAKQETAQRKAIARELEWIRKAPGAKRKKSKARVAAFDKLVEDAREMAKHRYTGQKLIIPQGPRLGNVVFEVRGVNKAFDNRTVLNDVSFTLAPGSILGIIGPNGVGKTTLLRMMTGELKPDSGEVKIGSTVKYAYIGQMRDQLNNDNYVWQEICGDEDEIAMTPDGYTVQSRAFVSSFNFRGPAQNKRVGQLSGGERNRVALAKQVKAGCNVLLMDEPTNDLDVDTLRALEEALPQFPGCAVIVSHDRWFLDRVCTHILAFEKSGRAHFHWGNYSDYMAERGNQLKQA